MRLSHVVPPVALGLSLVLLLVTWLHRPAVSAAIGQSFPKLVLAPLAGTPLLTDSFLRRGQPTVVNFFASWCVPCRAEAPQLVTLTAHGIAVAGIAVRDIPTDTQHFLASSGARFVAVGLDRREAVQPALGSGGLPETWVVDGGGIVRARFRGDLHPDDVARIEAAVAAAR